MPAQPEPTRRHGLRLGIVMAVAGLHAIPIIMLALYDTSRKAPHATPEFSIPVIFEPTPNPAVTATQRFAASTLHLSMHPFTMPLLPLPRLSITPVLRQQPPTLARVAQSSIPKSPGASMLAVPVQKSLVSQAPSPDLTVVMAQWEGRIREAVQEAAVYPSSARTAHRAGRAQVRFIYDLGTIRDASVAQTSHFTALDIAALTAVTTAAIPPPPADLGPQKRIMLVWVQFSLTAQD